MLPLLQRLDQETGFMLLEPGARNLSLKRQQELIREYSDANTGMLLVAEVDTGLAGFIGGTGGRFDRERHTLYLAMGVLQAYWGRSIGRRLLQSLEEWAGDDGYHRLELSVMEHNARARALYEKSGFEYEGMRCDALKLNGRYINEFYMAKLIRPCSNRNS